MKETKDQSVAGQLLQAREAQLQQLENSSLRPHGKLWGMDVFSWYNPAVYELESTLSSFPAPVLWFGNASDVVRLFSEHSDQLGNIRLVCTHDHGGFSLPEEDFGQVESSIGSQSLDDALKLIRVVKKDKGILLFTASGEDWKARRDAFEFFLSIHQS